MKHSRKLGWVAASLVGLACSASEPPLPVVTEVPDGSVSPGITIVDAAFRDARRDASDVHDAADASADADGDGGISSQVVVTIKSPVKDVRQVAFDSFKPEVSVAVATTMLGEPSTVMAEVWQTVAAKGDPLKVAGAKLERVRVERLPEMEMATYVYKDVAVDVHDLPSGVYELIVIATMRDSSVAKASVKFKIDGGPIIDIRKPTEGQSLRKSGNLELVVSDELFGGVENVVLTIGRNEIALTRLEAQNLYTASIDFDKFNPPLDGEQLITVRATNKQKTTSVANRKFLVDNDGPKIVNAVPASGQLIGQIIQISAEISDPAGVDDSSVVAVVDHGSTIFTVKLDPPATGAAVRAYTARFDTRLLPVNAIFPHVSFRASDKLGNEASIGYLVSLDNTPPLAELDPPSDMRGLVKSTDGLACSWPFDPVGPDAIDDGAAVTQVFDIRARIEDQGNTLLGGSADFVPIATVQQDSVHLLVMDDERQPLVVDTDGDEVCDAVNPLLVPTTTPMSSKDALLVNMVPIAPGGVPDMTPEPNAPCKTGSATLPPDPICDSTFNSSKVRWGVVPGLGVYPHSHYTPNFIPYAIKGLSAIWTIPPIESNKIQCAGRQFDSLGANVSEGWVCMAVVASDQLGNSQVSRVLRVCIDKDGSGDCPHVAVTGVSQTSPMVVTTSKAHGLVTGDEAIVSEVLGQTGANGRWTVTVTDANTFSLNGSQAEAAVPGSAGSGKVVPVKLMPDCTGTQTAKGPPATVSTKACRPWKTYKPGEYRIL